MFYRSPPQRRRNPECQVLLPLKRYILVVVAFDRLLFIKYTWNTQQEEKKEEAKATPPPAEAKKAEAKKSKEELQKEKQEQIMKAKQVHNMAMHSP